MQENKTEASRSAYKKQRNLCGKSLRNQKRFHNDLDLENPHTHRKNEQIVLVEKGNTVSKDSQLLVEKGNIVSKDSQLVEIISKYFTNIAKNLDIPR